MDEISSSFFLTENMAQATSTPFAGGEAVVIAARSPDREDDNEDAAVLIPLAPNHGVLALADGVGGHASGAAAARLALEAIDASVRNRDSTEQELRSAILDGFEMANETVRALGVGAGTTLAVVEIQQQWVRPYHVGDSGIVIVGQRGRIKARTVDHSPTGYAVEAGLMDDREALRHEERHLVSNMVGLADMRIEIGSSIQLASRDTVLMATDGLFDNLHFDDIVERVRTGALAERVNEISRESSKRMKSESTARPSKPDDMTIIAFRRRTTPTY